MAEKCDKNMFNFSCKHCVCYLPGIIELADLQGKCWPNFNPDIRRGKLKFCQSYHHETAKQNWKHILASESHITFNADGNEDGFSVSIKSYISFYTSLWRAHAVISLVVERWSHKLPTDEALTTGQHTCL